LLHVRNCGSFDVFYLGNWLIEQAQAKGAELIRDRVTGITTSGGRIESVQLAAGGAISPRTLVVAAGPLLPNIARMLDLQLPVYSELHAKITLQDPAHVFPRYSDLM